MYRFELYNVTSTSGSGVPDRGWEKREVGSCAWRCDEGIEACPVSAVCILEVLRLISLDDL